MLGIAIGRPEDDRRMAIGAGILPFVSAGR
jgi:hypothetical protein